MRQARHEDREGRQPEFHQVHGMRREAFNKVENIGKELYTYFFDNYLWYGFIIDMLDLHYSY